MTDTTRYKSIIVRVETHAKLKQMAGTDKKISGIVSQLVEKEWKKENRKAVQLLLSNEEEALRSPQDRLISIQQCLLFITDSENQ